MKVNKNISISTEASKEIEKLKKTIPQFSFSAVCEAAVWALKKKHKTK